MLRIAVISDSHGKVPGVVFESLKEADEIWHLGDFCNLSTLSAFVGIGKPFYGVLGNNDFGLDLPPHLDLTRFGRTFHIVHILPRRLPLCDFLLFGHTHVPRDDQVGSCRLLNPGTIGKPNKGSPPSWAWLQIQENSEVAWSLNPI
jgi:putative phosphoesterase